MVKNIFKEIVIVLLLCLAIIIVLGVLLYEYVPTNKIIPEKKAYTTPETIKSQIQEEVTEDTEIILTYEVDSTDLDNYEKINDYNPGKVNPFSPYQTEEETNNTTNTTDNNTGNTQENSSSTGNTNQNDDSTNHYFQNKGTK